MNQLLEQLKKVTDDLDQSNVRYAVVGGMALSLRVAPRFTRDLDLAIAVNDDAEAESIVHVLMGRGYRMAAQVEHETASRLATMRLLPPRANEVLLDLLFASCGIESEIVAAAERIEALPGWRPPVARPEHLVAMKVLAAVERRPQDIADALSLLAEMTPAEIDRAREALRLIEERGFHRLKNLQADLDRLLESGDDQRRPALRRN